MRGPTVADPRVERSSAFTSVVTPQAVLLEFRTAGIGSRVLAKVIDLAIQLVLLIAVSILSAAVGGGSAAFIVAAVGAFLVIFGYPTTEAFLGGQTVGKKALSIRVITADGGPVRFRHAAVRSLIGFVELFVLPPGGPMALISALLTKRSQRIGDLVAETVVVRDKVDPTSPVFFNPPVGAESLALTLDTTRLSHPQYGVLRDFLLRRGELTAQASTQVAADLTERLAATGLTRPRDIPPEQFIGAVVFAHQRRFASAPGRAPTPPSRLSPPAMAARLPGGPPVGSRVDLPPPPGAQSPRQ